MIAHSVKFTLLFLVFPLVSSVFLDAASRRHLKREHATSPVAVENPLLKHAKIALPAKEPAAVAIPSMEPSTVPATVHFQPMPKQLATIPIPCLEITRQKPVASNANAPSARPAHATLLLPAAPAATNLIEATKTGDVSAVEQILSGGADVNQVDAQGKSALMWATRKGNLAIVRCLLRAGADVNYTNRNQRVTPYMCAHFFKRTAILRSFKEHIVRQCGANETLAKRIMIQQELTLIESREKNSTKADYCPMLTQEIAPIIAQVSAKMGGPEHFTLEFNNAIAPHTDPRKNIIYITSQIIRQLLLNIPEGKEELFRAIFTDIIAHEIGHNIDPELQLINQEIEHRNTFLKNLLHRLTNLNVSTPAFLLAVAHSDTHIALATTIFAGAVCGSAALVAVNKLRDFQLIRRLENNADRLSLRGVENLADAPARWTELFKLADTYMHEALQADCASAFSQAKGAFVQKSPSMLWGAAKAIGLAGRRWLYIHGPHWLRTHPHDEKRIAHIQKHVELITTTKQ